MYDDNTKIKTKQVAKIEAVELHLNAAVRVQRQGRRHVEVVYMARPSKGGVTQKISADEYIDLRSGEVKQFKHTERKQRENLSVTFRALTGLIRTNFDAENEHKQLFITLTYAENMTDRKRLMSDWDAFYKRLKTYCKGHSLDYIAVAEPQERGAWHLHVMLKSDKALYIPNEDMEKLWRQGFTDTQRLKSDDVGRYYVAYFTDLFGEFGETAKKKGGRLHLYPVGMKFYRCSRGIKKPEDEEMAYAEVVERWGKPDFREAYEVRNSEDERIQSIQREHFKAEE